MDYYRVLGVNKNASPNEIKRAYRTLSMKHHPDRPTGNEEEFKKINEAYEVLSDDNKKRTYDLTGSADGSSFPFGGMGGMGGMGPFGSFSFHTQGSNAGHADPINMFGGEDFLKMFFGQNGMPGSGVGNGSSGPNIRIFRNGQPVNVLQKPTPIIKTIEITLTQAYQGYNYPLEIERWIKQDGDVKITEREKIYVTIPRGIDNDEIIILRNKGNVISEQLRGDIKCFVKIKNNTEFKRSGLNLVYNKKITLKEALCGFTFTIDYIDGKQYTINNNNGKIINPGFKKQINKMGMRRDDQIGNLIIDFQLVFPNSLNEKQIKAIQEAL